MHMAIAGLLDWASIKRFRTTLRFQRIGTAVFKNPRLLSTFSSESFNSASK